MIDELVQATIVNSQHAQEEIIEEKQLGETTNEMEPVESNTSEPATEE